MKIVAVDTETTGTDFFHGCRPFLVTACDGKNNYIWEGIVDPQTRNVHWPESELLHLQAFLYSCDVLVFHNTNFDRRALESIGIKLPSQKVSLEDTLVASHVICSGDVHGLKELAVKYLNYFEDDKNDLRDSVVSTRDSLSRNNPTKIQYAKKGHPHFPASRDAVWQQDMWLDMPLCKRYATGDVERTWLLYKVFHAELLRTQLMPQYRFRMKMLPILYRMQTVGIHIYTDKINRLIKELDLQIYQLEKNVSDECPYTISLTSPDDLRLLLYTVLKLEPINYTDSGLTSTDEGTLNLLEEEHDELDTIRYLKGWRKANKVRTDITAYKKWSDNNSRLHSSLNLTGTHWTRQTSSDPNQQNFNKKLKFIFGPPEGYYWLYADVVNIELRIWAYDVGAVDLIAAFERGESVHMIIARALYPDLLQKLGEAAFKETKSYTKCKGGTFARIYGGGVNKVNKTYGVQGACDVIDAKLPEVGQYFAQLEATRAHNETVFDYPCIFTIQGYRLDVPINKPYTVSSGRIQGSAGMIVQDMMIHLDADPVYKTKQCEMIQQVHDSLTLEIPCHTNSKVTNTHLISVMERTGEKHIPTCPMDYEVIPYHGDQEPEFRDYTFIPKKHKDYDIEMYIEDHKYKAVATYDKDDIITEYAATKQEAVTRICSQIDENEVPF